jgi:hypothetical protein
VQVRLLESTAQPPGHPLSTTGRHRPALAVTEARVFKQQAQGVQWWPDLYEAVEEPREQDV